MDEFDDFLDQGTTEPAQQPEAEGQPRDEHGRFAPKGVEEPQEAAEAVPPTDKLPQEDYKAIREEREKRQALERELEALKQQLQPQSQPQEPPPSIWEDDAAALDHNRQQAVSEATFNARLDMSEMLASQAHEDFDDKKAKFLEMMALNPALQQQALSAKHPWEKAYQIATAAMKMEALGAVDVGDLEAKLREKIAAEMAEKAAQPSNLPQSLADSQSARVSQEGGSAMLSLTDILGGR